MKVIVSEAEIDTIIEDDVLNIWEKTKASAGVSYLFFRQYYKGNLRASRRKLPSILI